MKRVGTKFFGFRKPTVVKGFVKTCGIVVRPTVRAGGMVRVTRPLRKLW